MSKLELRIFDGSRQLFSAPANFLVTIIDGNQKQLYRDFIQSNTKSLDLPFYDNFGDNYRVIVSTDDHKQAGFFPVVLSNKYLRTLDIMLVPNDPGFSFVNARWEAVSAKYPFLANGVDNATGAARYDMLLDQQERSLACFLNLVEAMGQINLSLGTPLSYIKQLRWDAPFAPAQDRFFAWCDPMLIDQVKIAAVANPKQFGAAPPGLHPGATSSWKQIQFGEANVQLTFHENDHQLIDGVSCIMVEPDMDYYQDSEAHILFEVVPNDLTHSLTDPVEVYVLRWMAGQQSGMPEFAPMYTITS
ncbi:MAG TPA: hypothetical protein VFD98_05025 [Terracidiphilus sp.]|nr:hypothetical protein [Terracidiphilus sp.]